MRSKILRTTLVLATLPACMHAFTTAPPGLNHRMYSEFNINSNDARISSGKRLSVIHPNRNVERRKDSKEPGEKQTALFSTRDRSKVDSNNGVTSNLISQLAVIALKLRLKSHSGVSCNVNASSRDLFLNSSIGPVTVKGKQWSSPLGLTCQAIEANVETCTLDMNSVVTKRKLILTTPATGKAMVALNEKDFGSFLTHPLLVAQTPSLPNRGPIEFCRDDVQIQHERGLVIFSSICSGQKWKCDLTRSGGAGALINVSHVQPSEIASQSTELDIETVEMELTMILTRFFNELVFELDGTFLSFQDMKVHRSKGKPDAAVLMALDIKVRKFPSPGIEF